ncbi:DnaJ homolog subfamily B member 14 [Anthophora retusa]
MSIQQIVNISKNMEIKLLQKSILLNLKVNLTTKAKTHYETLGISPNATYNEIKTAYYELTLKYHPDRNKSESAKHIFHEISNAYDVLSKYETRKHYDRTIVVKTKHTTSSKADKIKTVYPTSGMEKIYNFDEWVQTHYTDAFKQSRTRKEQVREQQKLSQKLRKEIQIEEMIVAIGLGIAVILHIYHTIKRSMNKEINSK